MNTKEIRWPNLLKILLHRLNRLYLHVTLADRLKDFNRIHHTLTINENPVTCSIYVNKLVDIVMKILSSKFEYNPFGKYKIQSISLSELNSNTVSPHAHMGILTWLQDDP